MDVILENDKFKEKLLLTNVKNSKNSQYYQQVINELKDRCKQRDSIFTYDLNQTRQKFKCCLSISRETALKIKTTSGIQHFQDKKEYGSWFKNLFEVVKSMDNCLPDQTIEPGTSTSSNSSNSKCEGTFNESITKTPEKRLLFVPIPETTRKAEKRQRVNIQSTLGKINEALNADPTKELISFLKEDSERQQRQDEHFLSLMERMLIPQSSMAEQHSFEWNFQ